MTPPPRSRKLAGDPPCSLMISIVAIASPAPFTAKQNQFKTSMDVRLPSNWRTAVKLELTNSLIKFLKCWASTCIYRDGRFIESLIYKKDNLIVVNFIRCNVYTCYTKRKLLFLGTKKSRTVYNFKIKWVFQGDLIIDLNNKTITENQNFFAQNKNSYPCTQYFHQAEYNLNYVRQPRFHVNQSHYDRPVQTHVLVEI